LKIALLSVFYPYRGGIAQFGAMLFRALEKHHEVRAYNFKKQYPNFLFPGSSQFVSAEDQVDAIPSERLLNSTSVLSFSRTAKAIAAYQPEVYIVQYWMTFFGPAMGYVGKRIRTAPRIAILHNLVPHEKRFFDGPANRYFLKHHDGFIVMSDAVLKDLLTLKPEAKYLRIDHPVYNQFGERMPTEEARKLLGLPKGKKYLLFFGIIRDYKGLDVMLETLALLSEEYHLIVAGETYGSFDKYAELIRVHALSERISLFNTYISDHEVTRYFSAADVCMLPYKSATQSGITAISHHFSTPIIATDVGGLKETIQEGATGFVVGAPEPALLAEAIERYFSEAHQTRMMENIAAQKEGNTWEHFAEKLMHFAQTLQRS
jgi:glycosyltransferase involved in cell wall biosynthesis